MGSLAFKGDNALSNTTELGGREKIWSEACATLANMSPGVLGKYSS